MHDHARNHGRDAVERWAAVLCGLIVAAAACNSGCASREKVPLTQTGRPDYQQLHIVYDFKSDAGHTRLDEPPGVQKVSHSTDNADEKSQQPGQFRLEIQYPHPDVHPEFARVTLRALSGESRPVSTAPRGSFDWVLHQIAGRSDSPKGNSSQDGAHGPVEEILVIDLPKTQLDNLLFDLAHHGFFDKGDSTSGESRIQVTYNKGEVEKGWTHEARLDDIAEILRRHGKPAAIQPTK
jgi:hypothetical protein